MAADMVDNESTPRAPPRVLAIDANFDDETTRAFVYRSCHVYTIFKQKGYAVDNCQGPTAVRSDVQRVALRPGIVYITGSGHGTAAEFQGYYRNSVYATGSYRPEEVQGKIVHFLSCGSAERLGVEFQYNNCRAFFGYKGPYIYCADARNRFFECDSEIDRAFAEGLAASNVFERVMTLVEQRVTEFRAEGRPKAAETLATNFAYLRCPSTPPGIGELPGGWGDPNARLV